MKENKRILLSTLVTGVLTLSALSFPSAAGEFGDKLLIISTNDVHCDIETNMGYSGLAAFRDEMVEQYGEDYVILVDAGDAIQGGPIGTLTEGQAIIDLMNAVEYDYFVPGNHEYDYGMEQGLYLMSQLTAKVISANFMDLTLEAAVYSGYDVVDFGEVQVGFVGMTTPESFTKSTPANFQDENGNYMYGFGENDNEIYDLVQVAIDDAISEGADFIVAVGHMGNESGSEPWRSSDIIANTTGIDVFMDGHSHEIMLSETVYDAQGNGVILTQTGSRFQNVGMLLLDLETLEFDISFVPEGYEEKSQAVNVVLDEINAEFDELLQEVVAVSEVDLVTNDPSTGDYILRSQETNLGNLVTDAYRMMLDAEIGLSNSGGIRAPLSAGEITYEDVITVHPFGNDTCVLSVTGLTLLNALEMGASAFPEGNGGFLHVSGMSYEIDSTIPSTVTKDDKGNFLSVEGDYRVYNVLVGGEPLDLTKEYTVASHEYLLLSGGDGMTMFQDATILRDKVMIDNEVLIRYVDEVLGGVIGEGYAAPYGEGRITLHTESMAEETVPTPEPLPEETTETTYVVVNGDTLSYIARDLLGSANRWSEIYERNTHVLKDPNKIYVGQVLTIPVA